MRTGNLARQLSYLEHLSNDVPIDQIIMAIGILAENTRCFVDPVTWLEECIPVFRNSGMHGLCLKELITKRSYQKPRGYAGDAELLDLIYAVDFPEMADPSGPNSYSQFELRIHEYCNRRPSAVAVRMRAKLATQRLTSLSRTKPGATVLSVAGGHMREMDGSGYSQIADNLDIIAADQDPVTIEYLKKNKPDIMAVETNVISIIRGKSRLAGKRFDFIYSLGLLDYLDDRTARLLCKKLFGMLSEGGKLWVANFQKGMVDRGYMEAFMDWFLIYRDEGDMHQLLDGIGKLAVWDDCDRNVVFAELEKPSE